MSTNDYPALSATPHWDIDAIVGALRDLRVNSLARRDRGDRPPKLPSRKALAEVLDGLSAILFPNRLGLPEVNDEGIDYYVGHTLDATLRLLHAQVRRELSFVAAGDTGAADLAEAARITQAFAQQLPGIRQLLETDIAAAYRGDPAARSIDEILVCYPGVTAITFHRIAHVLHRLGVPLIARIIANVAHAHTGIDIHPAARIGDHFFIDHGTGVVIGETAVIGSHVRLYQAVTLGAKRFPQDADGSLVKGGARHPVVEDDVVIYAGATILGRVTIGRGSTIGGNVWLTRSVPPHSQVSQATTEVRIDVPDAASA